MPEKTYKHSAYSKCVKTITSLNYKKDCSVLISALDDLAYILNARGKDIPCNPVFLAFMLLNKVNGEYSFSLYINSKKLSSAIKEKFKSEMINIKPYNAIYKDVAKINHKIFYDNNKTNYKLFSLMKNKTNKVLYPTLAKAIKTDIDIKESKKAHIKDGIAMCKFLYYLHINVSKNILSELSISKYLENLRKKQGAISLSFNTIAGYKEHGAIIHYSATQKSNKKIGNDGFLLVDSGGQYFYGTTDITRTIAFNNISEEMKRHFTLVLKAHIALSTAVFKKGTTDKELDFICRKPLWDNNLDYNHGTGHGVGHLLNVHEGPQSIRFNKDKPVVMKKGMITSNEPGLYFENKYGIRHENEILCISKGKDLLGFEPITYVPFDIKAIEVKMLNEKEVKWLNDYHLMVYKKISKYLSEKEKDFLKEMTQEVKYASN